MSGLTYGTGGLSFSYFFKSYFSFLKKIYLFLVALHLHCSTQALSSAVPGLVSSCGAGVLQCLGSVVAALGHQGSPLNSFLAEPWGMRDAGLQLFFPSQGLNPHLLQWMHEVLTTGLPGKSLFSFIYLIKNFLICLFTLYD